MAEGYLSKPVFLQQSSSFHDFQEELGMEIPQHLAPEQYAYEFPRKSYMMTLIDQDEYSSMSGDDENIMDDSLLSPLQATRIDYRYRTVSLKEEIHWEDIPFVFPDYEYQHVYPSIHPFHRFSMSTLNEDDMDSHFSGHSRVLMKINKDHKSPPTIYLDEGYEECMLIESASIFVPFMSKEEERAAIKIQTAWRNYKKKQDWETRYRALETRLDKEILERKALQALLQKERQARKATMELQQRAFLKQLDKEIRKSNLALETRLRHDMEFIMSRVLDQLHDMKVQLKEQAEKKNMVRSTNEKEQHRLDQYTKSSRRKKKEPSFIATK